MKKFTIYLLNKLGIDGAIGFTLFARIIQGGGALIVIALISLFLSKEEQGYYYTFGSIVALQIFFELGLNSIITQYVAHETVHLKWISDIELSGSPEHLSRLSSILHFCLKVFGILAIILFIVLTLSGFIFFKRYHQALETINWQFPWILVAFSTCLMLLVNPILAFLEGLGKVKEVAKLRLMQQSAYIVSIAIVFIFKGSLFALGVASLVSFLILSGNILFTYRRKLLLFIYEASGQWKVDYWKEIFPYQWKIALSWISGYFIFQLFNPVLFATAGAVVAGQMGMTLQALNGISSLSMSWITTKVPMFSSLIASKVYKKLDSVFNKTLIQLSVVNIGLLLIFIITITWLILFQIPLSKRFLPLLPIVLLCIVIFVNQFVFSWATYLRCHKQEPFLINSIVVGILCALSTIFLGMYFGLMGIVVGYTSISLFIGFPWAYLIFIKKRNEWHIN
jgi:O-antigen/teichoic acid export membrane protein